MIRKTIATFLLFASKTVSAADIVSPNCPLGCPSIDIEGNTVVFERLYALSQNPKTKFADWVAYEVNVLNFGTHTNRKWGNNELLSDGGRLEEKDYKGASKALKVDRGHQAPLASFTGSRYWPTLNYLSNITPQASGLNQGPWMHLEAAVRDAVGFRESLYVITGPLYDDDNSVHMPNADESHIIPDSYYKIVYDEKGNAASFIMSQKLGRKADYCTTSTTVISVKSQVTFSFPDMLIDSQVMLKRLGCQ